MKPMATGNHQAVSDQTPATRTAAKWSGRQCEDVQAGMPVPTPCSAMAVM